MKEYQSLAHTRWDCKYHVVFIPKSTRQSDTSESSPANLFSAPLVRRHPTQSSMKSLSLRTPFLKPLRMMCSRRCEFQFSM